MLQCCGGHAERTADQSNQKDGLGGNQSAASGGALGDESTITNAADAVSSNSGAATGAAGAPGTSSGGTEGDGSVGGLGNTGAGGFAATTATSGAGTAVPPDSLPAYASGPYGYCTAAVEPVVPHCDSGEFHASVVQSADTCLASCLCIVGCESDEDCPRPDSGTVVPECRNGECTLPCEEAACPEGMTCSEILNQNCTWEIGGEDFFGCWISTHPDHCAQYTAKDDCQAVMDGDPLLPPAGCIWARETRLPMDAESCEVLETDEHCVPGTRIDARDPSTRCEASGLVVHVVTEEDAVVSIETDPAYAPSLTSDHSRGVIEACHFDGSITPEHCACTCDPS